MGSNVRLSLSRVKTTNGMFKRNYFNPKSAICNNIIFYKFPTFTISFVLCMIFTCNPSGFRKFRSLHIQFVELEQNMMQQLGLHEAPTNNLKNIMVITALSNIPDVRQDVYVQAKRTADFDSMES